MLSKQPHKKTRKIWIQWNRTEDDIAAELVALDVSKEDIVLGFHTPYMRQFTDFAVVHILHHSQ